MSLVVKEGNYLTLGAKAVKNQVTFTFEGEKEDVCRIVLVHKATQEKQFVTVPEEFCMGSLRSISVSGFNPQEYNYKYEINGEEILDPYASVIVGREKWNDESRKAEKYKLSGGFISSSFAWGQDKNPEIAKSDMIMYKLHVRGFTMGNKTAGKAKGTFLGVKNKIPYLKELGITTVELMPIYEFEEMPIPKEVQVPEYVKCQPETADKIQSAMMDNSPKNINFWGYGEGQYFAVKSSYASEPEKASTEFKKLVKTLHENHMECVMEMFFPETTSHTLIMEVLHYWTKEYHVDGFHIIGGNLPITSIVQDPLLSRTKIFADNFNGQFDIRRKYKNLYIYREEYQYAARQLLNHYDGDIREFVNQQKKQGENYGFVNFIAYNNGMTLADLFMYSDKHNEANGEKNCDGTDFNISNNYGVEGPTRKRFINETRMKKVRMAFTMLMFAQGVPLIYAGDEFGNTQGGNNNAYCQDNETGWVNWSLFAKYKEVREYIKQLVQFRREYSLITKEVPFKFNDYRSKGAPDLSYHGENAWIAQLDPGRKSLGMLYCGAYAKEGANNNDIYVGYNFYSEEVQLALPNVPNKEWYYNDEKLENQQHTMIPAQSIRVLFGREMEKKDKKKRNVRKK
ncbi:MAG: glycogen operon protein GlgX [Agathobacter sp.]|nr:glycogen operon protein GlgX [Agathobacter sp.]